MSGRFGLGAWHTQNEFKEFRIYDEQNMLVFSDDFTALDQWDTPGIGQWAVEGGLLKQRDLGKGPAMLFLKEKLQTGRVTVKAHRTGGNEGFLMFFHASGPDRYMFCNYGAAGNQFSAIQGNPAEGLATKGGGDIQGPIERDRWYDISLVLTKNSAEMLLDGKRVSRIEAEWLPAFFATAGYHRSQKLAVVRATNYRDAPVPLIVELAGTQSIGPSGEHLVLRADSATDENSLDEPLRIQPQRQALPGCSRQFTVELAPRSVNVLRIPAEPARPE